jgi:hypothetical protein
VEDMICRGKSRPEGAGEAAPDDAETIRAFYR